MKCWLLPILTILLFSCSDGFHEEPVTKADALALARTIDSGVVAGDRRILNRVIDEEVFAREVAVAAGRKMDADFRKGITKSLETKELAAQIIESVKEGGTYQLVRYYEKDGRHHLIYRAYGEDGLNYHDLTLIKRNGKVRARDMYMLLTGENLSKTLADVVSMLMKQDGAVADKGVAAMQKVRHLHDQQRFEEADAEIKRLPESIRNQRAVMIMRLTIASNVDSTAYAAALADFNKLYGNDPGAQFALFDDYFNKGEYDRVLRIVDDIDKMMQDPMLDFYRALIYKQQEKFDTAATYLEKVHRAMPGFSTGTIELLAMYIQLHQYDKANALIPQYKASKDFDPEVLDGIRALYPTESKHLKM